MFFGSIVSGFPWPRCSNPRYRICNRSFKDERNPWRVSKVKKKGNNCQRSRRSPESGVIDVGGDTLLNFETNGESVENRIQAKRIIKKASECSKIKQELMTVVVVKKGDVDSEPTEFGLLDATEPRQVTCIDQSGYVAIENSLLKFR